MLFLSLYEMKLFILKAIKMKYTFKYTSCNSFGINISREKKINLNWKSNFEPLAFHVSMQIKNFK